jgi:hypothetical protein
MSGCHQQFCTQACLGCPTGLGARSRFWANAAIIGLCDSACSAELAKAAARLIFIRGEPPDYAPGVIGMLGALIAQGQAALADEVADAREAGYQWAYIGDALDLSPSAARARYGAYVRWRRPDSP